MSSIREVTWHPLIDGCPPAWASGWGEDRDHGPFVQLTVGDATQWLRWIPPGEFLMGSPEDEPGRYDDEGPQHVVRIWPGFWLFDTPVTQAMWEAVLGADANRSRFRSAERPVENVSWEDCEAFLRQIRDLIPGPSIALPTEAEWEYACRAGTTEATSAGPIEILGATNAPILDEIAWYGGNSGVEFELDGGAEPFWPEKQHDFDRCGTHVVATKAPNPWGLYDMLGNVWEWCQDTRRDYSSEAVVAPVAPEDASAPSVVRGGSWRVYARDVRAAYRGWYPPSDRVDVLGFRCRVR